jgi:mono/diheme cytochrome c family protein
MKRMIGIFILLVAGAICLLSQAPLAAATLLPAPVQVQTPVQRGKKVYEQTCMPCHQVDGSGVPGMNPPLQKSPYVGGPPARLIGIVLQGLNDGVEIAGDTYSNPMPPFSTVLKDGEIADVLSYLRGHFGNKAGLISLAQVSRIRQSLKK